MQNLISNKAVGSKTGAVQHYGWPPCRIQVTIISPQISKLSKHDEHVLKF